MLSLILSKPDNNSNAIWWSTVNATRLSLVTKKCCVWQPVKKKVKTRLAAASPSTLPWAVIVFPCAGASEDVLFCTAMLVWLGSGDVLACCGL